MSDAAYMFRWGSVIDERSLELRGKALTVARMLLNYPESVLETTPGGHEHKTKRDNLSAALSKAEAAVMEARGILDSLIQDAEGIQ
jgi:hypothetical protein